MYLFLVLALELYKIDAKRAESFQWFVGHAITPSFDFFAFEIARVFHIK